MIKIVAKHTIKPECIDAFLETIAPLVEASGKEEGNIYYNLNKAIEQDNVYTMLEEWKDQAAIDAHNASSHFTTIVPKLAPFFEEPAEVVRYEEIQF